MHQVRALIESEEHPVGDIQPGRAGLFGCHRFCRELRHQNPSEEDASMHCHSSAYSLAFSIRPGKMGLSWAL
jgi:hypothetical protein